MEGKVNLNVEDLAEFAKWFNESQWRGGKDDPLKILFCKCDYDGIVRWYIAEKEEQELAKIDGAVVQR